MSPSVSVIVPAYNAEDTLADAVVSVLNGSVQEFEVLIGDDGSSDGTLALARHLAEGDSRIRVLGSERNLGVCKTRNRLVQAATGRYVAFLDSDDTWEPAKLEVCMAMLAEHPGVRAVGHALRYLTMNGKKVGYIPARPCSYEDMQRIRSSGSLPHVYPSSVVLERLLYLEEGGFAEDWPAGEDTELFARIAWGSGLLATAKPLGSYRLRKGSLTEKHWLKKRLAPRCVMENYYRMKDGEPPLGIVEYEQRFRDGVYTSRSKLRVLRRMWSRHLLRRAGELWLCEDRLAAGYCGIGGALLSPIMTVSRLRARITAAKDSFEEAL